MRAENHATKEAGMHEGWNLIAYELRRLFFNPIFYGTIFCVVLAATLAAWQDIRLGYEGLDVVFLFQYAFDIGSFSRLLPILAALSASASYVADLNSGILNFVRARMRTGQYMRSRFFSCACSGFLTLFLGWTVYIALLSLRFPVAVTDAGNYETYCERLYGFLLYRGHPVLYILVQVLGSAICGGFWAVVGLTVSAYLPSSFVAIAAPFLINDILYSLVNASAEKWHSPSNVAKGIAVGGDLTSFLTMTGYFAALTLLCYFLFSWKFKRRHCRA